MCSKSAANAAPGGTMAGRDPEYFLHPEKMKSIAKRILKGVPLRSALGAQGIPARQWRHWRQALEEGDQRFAAMKYVLDAVAQLEERCTEDILEHPDWRAKGWLLERHHQDIYHLKPLEDAAVKKMTDEEVTEELCEQVKALPGDADARKRLFEQLKGEYEQG